MLPHVRKRLLIGLLVGVVVAGGSSIGIYYWIRHQEDAEGQRELAAAKAAERHDLPRAREHIQRCLEIWPNQPEVRLLAARLARRHGDQTAALEHLVEYQRLPGKDDAALALESALVQAQQGELGEVEGYLQRRVEENHPDSVYILEALADAYKTRFQFVLALQCLDRWLELAPDDIQALLWRGEVNHLLGSFSRSQENYRRAHQLKPDLHTIRALLAESLIAFNNYEEATEHAEFLYRHMPNDPRAQLVLALCRRAQAKPAEARALFDRVLAVRPDDVRALVGRSRIAMEEEQFEQAEKWLREAVRLAPRDRIAVKALGDCLGHMKKETEAAVYRARENELNEDVLKLQDLVFKITRSHMDLELRCDAGLVALRLDDVPQGLGWLLSVVRANPQHRRARRALADYFGSGNLEMIRPKEPAGEFLLHILTQEYQRTQRYPRVIDCVSLWLSIHEDDTNGLVQRGRAWLQLRHFDRGVEDFRRAVQLRPDLDEVRLRLAEVLVEPLGRYAEAAGHLEALREKVPDHPTVLVNLALCRHALQRTPEAVRLLDEAIAKHPKHVPALVERGKLGLQEDQARDMEPLIRRAVQLAPSNREAVEVLHRCLQQLKKTDEAQAVAKRLDQLDADRKLYQKWFKEATDRPNDLTARYEVGVAALRTGRDAEGVRWLETVLEQDPKHRPSHLALADYFEQSMEPARAAQHRALAQSP